MFLFQKLEPRNERKIIFTLVSRLTTPPIQRGSRGCCRRGESTPASVADVTRSFKRCEHPKSCGSGWHSMPCAQSMRIPTSLGFYRHLNITLSRLWFPHASKKSTIVPIPRKIKSHAWMTGGPLLWPPSSASVLRSSSENTSALCCLPHWIRYNLHTAVTVPQTMLCLHPAHCSLPPGK